MPKSPIQIYIVDDELSVRTAYARLARSSNMIPQIFASVEEFMQANVIDDNACVVADVRMHGSSGLTLPVLLSNAGRKLPVIFVTAHDTPEIRDQAQRAGASAFFRKPVDGQALMDAVIWALEERSERRPT